jgi:AraC-like DNA-binding protein
VGSVPEHVATWIWRITPGQGGFPPRREPREDAGMHTVDPAYLTRLLSAADDVGVARADALALAQVDEALLAEGSRVPSAAVNRIWDLLAERADDPWIGLHVAEATDATVGGFGVVRYACGARGDVLAGLVHYTRYGRIADSQHALYVRERESGTAHVGWGPPSPCAYADQFGLALIYKNARMMTQSEWAPREVCFAHPMADDRSEASRVFDGAPIGTGASELVLDAEVLKLPLVGADAALANVLSGYAEELLARVPDDSIVNQVRRAVVEGIAHDASLVAIAERLGTSARTLQRRLKEEGHSHQAIVDDVRKELSQRYLRDASLSVSAVAFLLGYSELTSFSRAFKKWLGVSPAAWRAARG